MRWLRISLMVLAVAGLLAALTLSMLPLPARVHVALSPVVYAAEGAVLRAYLNQEDKWRFPVDLNALPSFVIDGLLCLEDKRFFSHPGVDPLAMGRALWQNLRAGGVVSGGSTISMQVIRLLEPRARTIMAKFIESLRALHLEWHLSKAEILRLYLTYAPYGGNVEGIAAASYLYFGHGPDALTHAEAAFLSVLPQAPGRWQTYSRQEWRRARQRILERLAQCGLLSAEDVQQAEQVPLPTTRQQFPMYAAHFADFLLQRHPDQVRLNTTVSIDVQRFLEQLVQRQRRALAANEIHNVAILVVDHTSRGLRGIVGNFDYLDTDHGQSFAAFAVPRSPGSTLKPLLYALALDQGMLLPETLLVDVPTRFQHYAPANFSGTHLGLVEAETALAHSLNVPFVRLLHRLGLEHFLSFLELGGLQIASDRRQLGLSTIIGGIEVSPLALVTLYANLANGGRRGNLRMLATDVMAETVPWLSAGAVYLTDRALAKRDRPDFPRRKEVVLHGSDIRWKTGTSQGRRDAWSIGYDTQYTVLVWLGNLDHTPSVALVGAESAAPIMFEILEGLRHRSLRQVSPSRYPLPALSDVEVCTFSGDRAAPYCPVTTTVSGIRDRIPTHTCRFHTRILRDADSGLRLLRGCDAGLRPELVSVLDLPASVLTWLRTTFPDQVLLPRFHPQCPYRPIGRGALTIRSPANGSRYLLLPSFGLPVVRIPLDLHSSGASEDISCLLNGQQLRGAAAVDRVLQLGPGAYDLFCTSMDGASDAVSFKVTGPSTLPRLYRHPVGQ